MVIAAAALALTLILGALLGLRRPRASELVALGAGTLGILGTFELFRLARLGASGYAAWWKLILPAIGRQAGVSGQGPPSASFLGSVMVRFSSLSLQLDAPRVLLGIFLISPYLLILLLAIAGKLSSADRAAGSLILLASMSGGYLLWWLLLTPANRIWLRRVIDGVLLHELLSVVALAVALGIVRGRGPGEQGAGNGRFVRGVAGALAAATAVGMAAFAWRGIAAFEIRRRPTEERIAAERLAQRIRRLPPGAVVYGRGWWQAPVVSFLAGRHFADLDWIPDNVLETDLESNYFVADRNYSEAATEDLAGVLGRMDYQVIDKVFGHSLVRVRRLYPYAPFSAQERERPDLKGLVNVVEDDYPYVRGLHDVSGTSRWARRDAGILLRRGSEGCLKVSLWFPELSGYRDGRVDLAVEVDDVPVRQTEVMSGGSWQAVVAVPRAGLDTGRASEVELRIDNWWLSSGGTAAELGFLMQEVGFVDCASLSEPSPSEQARGWPAGRLAVIFSDGFENQGLGRWARTAP
jgi:hypothetical protein